MLDKGKQLETAWQESLVQKRTGQGGELTIPSAWLMESFLEACTVPLAAMEGRDTGGRERGNPICLDHRNKRPFKQVSSKHAPVLVFGLPAPPCLYLHLLLLPPSSLQQASHEEKDGKSKAAGCGAACFG